MRERLECQPCKAPLFFARLRSIAIDTPISGHTKAVADSGSGASHAYQSVCRASPGAGDASVRMPSSPEVLQLPPVVAHTGLGGRVEHARSSFDARSIRRTSPASTMFFHLLILPRRQNYVVQYVLEHTDKQNRAAVIDTLSGHLLPMSRHKFASNVCEKALIFGDSAGRRKVIAEILGPNGDSATVVAMMKDQFASE